MYVALIADQRRQKHWPQTDVSVEGAGTLLWRFFFGLLVFFVCKRYQGRHDIARTLWPPEMRRVRALHRGYPTTVMSPSFTHFSVL